MDNEKVAVSFEATGEEKESLIAKLMEFEQAVRAYKQAQENADKLKALMAIKEADCFLTMESLNTPRITVKIDDQPRTFFQRTDEYMNLKAKNKDVAAQYVKDLGYEYLFKETINSRSLTSAMKEFREQGGEIDTEMITIKAVARVGIRQR